MILFLFLLLCFMMALIGGRRGIQSIKTLLINAFIALISIYLICYAVPSWLVMFISSLLFCIVTLFFQNGYNAKTVSAFIATLLILACMGILLYLLDRHAYLGGINEFQYYDEEYDYLVSAVHLNLHAVFLTSFLWGELGAIMDTSISISSAIYTIKASTPDISRNKLLKHGMQVGKDILGTTINTLVFVALGESILLTLLYLASGYSFAQLVNSKSFFQELTTVLFSCMGCTLIIPVTAFISTRKSLSYIAIE